MNFDQFTPLALRTASKLAPISIEPELLHDLLSTAIAIGNLVDYVKKNFAYNKPIDMDLWREQLTTIVRLATDLQTVSLKDFTSNVDVPLAMDPQMFHGIIGSFTESTELLEAAQKAMVTGEYDYVNIKEEIADGQWYNAIMLDQMKADMGDLLSTVIKKLQLRYPDKYSDNAAINRDVVAERKVLEGN